MRKNIFLTFGILSLLATWGALYGWALFDANAAPGADWQLLKPAATATSPHCLEVGPTTPVESATSSHERVEHPAASLLSYVSTKPTSSPPTSRTVTFNGTVLFVQELVQFDKTKYRPQLVSLRYGGSEESLQGSVSISNSWWHDRPDDSTFHWAISPQLAADPGSARFASHVYCVWNDGNEETNQRIFFSSSTDHGESWSQPTILSERFVAEEELTATKPSIAVNKQGVIAVSWYSREDLAAGEANQAAHEWNVRMRTSLDGGTTWIASEQVNEQSSHCLADAEKTNRLTANADGSFQATWIDSREGNGQLRTAAVEVKDRR